MIRIIIGITALALGLSGISQAQQTYPSRPINWVVGFPPGGGADGVTRLVAAKLSQNMRQPVVVENRPGASSIIAAQHVAQSAPDGYTLLMGEQGNMVLNAALFSKLPYDPQKDLVPVINMIRAPLLLVVNSNVPVTDFKSFVEYAQREAGKLNFGSPGRGLAHHLAMERLKSVARLDIPDVQYRGIGPVTQDVVSGQIPVAVIDTVVVLPFLKSGKLRAIASFSSKRLSVTPDVPSLAELGLEGMDAAPVVGVAVPRGTPRAIVDRLNAEVGRALRDPEVAGKLTGLGLEIIGDTPEQFAAFLDAEAKRWLPLIRSLNIRLD